MTNKDKIYPWIKVVYEPEEDVPNSTQVIELSEEEFFNEEERANMENIVITFEVIRKTMCVGEHALLYLVWNCTHRGLRMKSVECILEDDIIITSTASTGILWPGDVIRVIELNLKQKVKEG